MTDQPEFALPADGQDHGDRDQQIAAILKIVGTIMHTQRHLEGRVAKLAKTTGGSGGGPDRTEQDQSEPASWVWFPPPAAAEDTPGGADDPRRTVENFVVWYNATFAGLEGSRSRPIPACWQQHPGLAMEVACLAYSWRAANIGPSAHAREAQYWLHQWRPGFAERLTRDWLHTDCVEDEHRPAGAAPRDNRFTVAEQHAAVTEVTPGDGSA